MNEEYLWNKTGEPDPEVKELEEILGVLRYQPRKLELPQDIATPRRRSLASWLAIAATVVLALLAAGIWLKMKSTNTPAPETVKKSESPAAPAESNHSPTPGPNVEERTATNETKRQQQTKPRKLTTSRTNQSNRAAVAVRNREREEALAVKEQLLIALRLASEKLNQAQRKTQTPVVPNQNRNQHKVG